MTHAYPRLEWTDCRERPDSCRRVLVLHKARPRCRYFSMTVGWWNSAEWRRDDSDHTHGVLYQPWLWRDIELPPGFKSEDGHFIKRA